MVKPVHGQPHNVSSQRASATFAADVSVANINDTSTNEARWYIGISTHRQPSNTWSLHTDFDDDSTAIEGPRMWLKRYEATLDAAAILVVADLGRAQ